MLKGLYHTDVTIVINQTYSQDFKPMKTLINPTLTFFVLASFLLQSCSQTPEPDSKTEFENLPAAELELISEFDQSGDYFFQHLNYTTEVLSSGDILLNDRQGGYIIRVNPQGEFVSQVAGQGNGPGEVQDPLSIQLVDESTLLIVDQRRMRIIKKTLDSTEIDEFTVPQGEASRVSQAYATTDPDIISVKWSGFYEFSDSNVEPVTRISSYNPGSEEFISDIRYPGVTMAALLSNDGQPLGATKVPFTPELLFDYSADKTELYMFWSEDSQITVFDPIQLDTIRTIPIDLISESLSSTELDSLEGEYDQSNWWEAVEELLPDQKAPADKMIVDHQNRIWLKLTLQSDYQKWIVLDQTGSPQFRVQFPKEGMVTHISEHHIGFRADDHLFSLYELVE